MKLTRQQIAEDLKRALHIRKMLTDDGHTYTQEYINSLEKEAFEITARAKEYLEETELSGTHREKSPVQYWMIRWWIAFKMYWRGYITAIFGYTLVFHALLFAVKLLIKYYNWLPL